MLIDIQQRFCNSNAHGGLNAFNPRAPELYSPTGKVLSSGGGVGDIGIFAGGNGFKHYSIYNNLQQETQLTLVIKQ